MFLLTTVDPCVTSQGQLGGGGLISAQGFRGLLQGQDEAEHHGGGVWQPGSRGRGRAGQVLPGMPQ